MINYEWEKFSIPILKAFCSCHQANTRILVVEGKTDKDFYYDLFSDFQIGNVPFSLKRNTILFDVFSKSFKNYLNGEYFITIVDAKTRKQKRNEKDREQAKEISDIIPNKRFEDYDAYAFVCSCINEYNRELANEDELSKYNLYGFIDKDFGHDNIIEQKQFISITDCHDRETTLLLYYLPLYYGKEIMSKDMKTKLAQELAKIADFCMTQGLLERASFIYERKHINDENFKSNKYLVKSFSHYFFKDRADKNYERWYKKLDIDNYLNERKVYKYSLKDNSIIEMNGQISQDYFDIFQELKSAEYGFKPTLHEVIRKWIFKEVLTSDDKKSLETIFNYSNGHIFLTEMIQYDKLSKERPLFKMQDETDISNWVNNYIHKEKMYEEICKIMPLREYKDYRLKR